MDFRRTLLVFLWIASFQCIDAQSRRIINLPDIDGYKTLKCDFHMHTVFSDGTVWPTVRVQEAWNEGLDAISITDHIEYRPHSLDITADHNRSFEIAEPLSKELGIILIQGAEITRRMPLGHLSALFITNANLLDREDVNDALQEAREQGAFIIWNHPCRESQQPDSTMWWEEHSRLYDNDLMHGIEVYNLNLCPEALKWAIEKKLTMFGNADLHGPMVVNTGHRPLTLVFAKSRTEGGIKEALFAGRSVVYFNNTLIGNSSLLEPLFNNSLDFDQDPLKLDNGVNRIVNIKNNSDVDYELEMVQPGVGFDAPASLTLKAHQMNTFRINGNSEEVKNASSIHVYYQVKNIFTDNNENLLVTLSFRNK